MATKLGWLFRMRRVIPNITFGNYRRPDGGEDLTALAQRMLGLPDPGMQWRDIADLRAVWKGPLLLKGILHPADAVEAVANGVDGMFVSNHGGRQLDGAASALDALPAVAEAVGGRATVILDGGIRRGAHIVKALALGADCCTVGRPQFWGLSVAGEAGVAHVFDTSAASSTSPWALRASQIASDRPGRAGARHGDRDGQALLPRARRVAAAAAAVWSRGTPPRNGGGDGAGGEGCAIAETGGPRPEPTRTADWNARARIEFLERFRISHGNVLILCRSRQPALGGGLREGRRSGGPRRGCCSSSETDALQILRGRVPIPRGRRTSLRGRRGRPGLRRALARRCARG